MSVEFDRESPGKFDSRILSRETLSRWTGRISEATLRNRTDHTADSNDNTISNNVNNNT